MAGLVAELVKAGIPAKAYARGPLGKDSFVISINRNEHPLGMIKIFEPATVTPEVFIDRKKKQAVINVNEERRVQKKTVRVRAKSNMFAISLAAGATSRNNPFRGTVFPRTPTYKGRVVRVQPSENANLLPLFTVEVTASVPKSTQSFLVGMDETANFVALLNKTDVKSVDEAHAALRPPVVEKVEGALRQGEWFFVPIGDKEWREVERAVQTVGPDFNTPLEGRGRTASSHRAAQTVRYGDSLYAIGYILDNRKGHHAPLYLDDWHRVVRNLENVSAPNVSPRARRYWD